MKFSHSIQFNAVPDWSSEYISYSNLKKLIYQLEKQVVNQGTVDSDDTEASALIRAEPVQPIPTFRRALDHELKKIVTFYASKEKELRKELAILEIDAQDYIHLRTNHGSNARPIDGQPDDSITGNSRPSAIDEHGENGSDYDGASDTEAEGEQSRRLITKPVTTRSDSTGSAFNRDRLRMSRRNSQSEQDFYHDVYKALVDGRSNLNKRTIQLFVSLRELKSYSQLNKTGFTKALKKFDKTLETNLRPAYLEEKVNKAHPFRKETMDHLDEAIAKVEGLYADIITGNNLDQAKRELRLHLREHVVWERNTVWRDMIGIERKAQAAKMGLGRNVLGAEPEDDKIRLLGDEVDTSLMRYVNTPVGRVRCPKWLFSSDFFMLLGVIAIFTVCLSVKLFDTPEQQNCFAILVFVSLLWATEIIPLFVTSMLVPFLVVVFRVLRDDVSKVRLEPKDASKTIFAAMWTPVIMLLLGGFTIAAALSKYDIAKLFATTILNKAGTKPKVVLVANMFVAMFASMWISNVAAPVLCFSLIEPMLRTLPIESKFPKPLIMGIALASNIGGMASPIASPQNVIALQNMSPAPSWGEWFFVALPVSIISILIIWVVLLLIYRPARGTVIVSIRPPKDKFTGTQYFISIVTLVTIVLWCVSHQLEHIIGDMGVVAIIPLVLFFGTGILTKEDFNNFLWTIIMLAGGGLSLGKAVNSSGLLQVIAENISKQVAGMGLYGVFVIFAGIVLVVATFISHTVAALIFLPIVAEVGASMPDPHPRILVMGVALMCSAAMGLPTSGFPNMTAIMMENPQNGRRYLRVKHFLHTGVPSSVLTYLIVITIGWGLMRVIGF
ncbi:SPX-domain-containing protein [Ascobolus immersus RN42]|uniref:SPX-domain-containing protein n=1 Tax=Ascobolus immersus RN42 TaxID=1160509 RepID=A0A3N4ILE5_ASCIM|nr:SPX-domain-containing protein [Ascobolus immersus RN42]